MNTTKPIVQMLGLARCFRVYLLCDIIYLRKRQVLFKLPTFEKTPFFQTRNLENASFLGRIIFPLIHTRSL